MKVAIFIGYGLSGFPEHIQNLITETSFPEYRCGSVIPILESYPNEQEEYPTQEKYDNIKNGDVLRYGDLFYLGTENYPIQCFLKDVDISKRWTIEDYDGAEGIEYLDNYKCVSDKLNYWEKIR